MSEWGALQARLQEVEAEQIDVRFSDLAGHWHQLSIPASRCSELAADPQALLTINGALIPGWSEVTDAELVLRPDPATAFADPFSATPALAVIAQACEAATGLDYDGDPRAVASRALAFAERKHVADHIAVAFDFDCHIVERANFDVGVGQCAASFADRSLNAGSVHDTGLGVPLNGAAAMTGGFSMPPGDSAADIRAEMAAALRALAVPGVAHNAGSSPALNCFSFPPCAWLDACDSVQIAKFVIRQVAASYGRTATFLPKPLPLGPNDKSPGAGLAIRLGLHHRGKPVFAGSGYADLSSTCSHFIAGIIAHGQALNALTNPTTNSYRRLRPDREAPAMWAYAAHNHSAAVRIPFTQSPDAKAIDLRFPDPTCNIYLAMAAILLAGIDGIERKLDPGDAVDRNLYNLSATEGLDLKPLCRSLDEALAALEANHEFLLAGDVFSETLIQNYIALKRQEIARIEAVPHPAELALYW